MSGGAGKNWWRAPQNPAATHYVYENEQLTGGIRFTLLAIALEMPRRCTTSVPMHLLPLVKWTRLSGRQLYNHLNRLEELGEIRRHRVAGTKLVRYEMAKLAGPLFVTPRIEDPEIISGSQRRRDPEICDKDAEIHDGQDPEIYDKDAEIISGSSAPSTSTCTKDHVRTYLAPNPQNAQAVLDMHAFVDWWRCAWPQFHGEDQPCIDAEDDVVLDVLRRPRVTLDVLRQIAALVWTMEADDDPTSDRTWVAESDHNFRVIRYLLDKRARFLWGELRAASSPDDSERGDDVWSSILRRIEFKLNRASFWTWFRRSCLVADRGDVIEVCVASAEIAAMNATRYGDVVRDALAEIGRADARVEFTVMESDAAALSQRL